MSKARTPEGRTLRELGERAPSLPSPDFDSYVTGTIRRLLDVPIAAFGVEDLRFMIGQDLGVRWLMPEALAIVTKDPPTEGDMGPGDLLIAVLRALHVRPTELARERSELLERLNDFDLPNEVREVLEEVRGVR